MNKRIRKKRAKMGPLHIGNNIYTRDEIKIIIMNDLLKIWLLPRIYFTSLDPNESGIHIWRKRNIKRAVKYMYKHSSRYLSSYKHLRFARHLEETMNSCEAASMEVD